MLFGYACFGSSAKLSVSEQQKIKCSHAHFQEFDDVAYKVVSRVGDLVD